MHGYLLPTVQRYFSSHSRKHSDWSLPQLLHFQQLASQHLVEILPNQEERTWPSCIKRVHYKKISTGGDSVYHKQSRPHFQQYNHSILPNIISCPHPQLWLALGFELSGSWWRFVPISGDSMHQYILLQLLPQDHNWYHIIWLLVLLCGNTCSIFRRSRYIL